jgi:hypothetical protein
VVFDWSRVEELGGDLKPDKYLVDKRIQKYVGYFKDGKLYKYEEPQAIDYYAQAVRRRRRKQPKWW